MHHIFQRFYDLEGVLESEKSNCVYPEIVAGKFSNYFYVAFGNYAVEQHIEAYRNLLAPRATRCDPHNILDYLDLFGEVQTRMTPLKFGSQYLHRIYENPSQHYGPMIVMDNGIIDNLFLFHALSWSSYSASLILPNDLLNSSDDYLALSEWINENFKGTTYFTLLNADQDLESLRLVRSCLKGSLSERFKNVDLVSCNFAVDSPHLYDKETQQQVRFEGRSFTFTSPHFDLVEASRNSQEWIVQIDLAPEMLNSDGFLPSKFPGMTALMSGYSLKDLLNSPIRIIPSVRITRGSIAVRSSKHQIRAIKLPTTDDLFTLLFQNCGLQTRKDEKGRYYQGMLKLAGELDDMSILRHEIGSKIVADHGLISGKAYSIDEMMKRFKLGKQIADLKDVVSGLALKSILLRGYYLKCANCDLVRWYPIIDGNERMMCQGCFSKFQMSTDVQQSYRLNELFVQGIEQGGRTVLLTLLVLKATVNKSMIWDVGFKLQDSDGEVDIDLAAMCDGHLIMCECKDSIPSNTLDLIAQLERSLKVAERAGANFFIVSTLSSDIPDDLMKFIDEYEAQAEMLIYVFDKDDLMRGYLVDSENKKTGVFIKDMVRPTKFYQGQCHDEDTDNSMMARMMSF